MKEYSQGTSLLIIYLFITYLICLHVGMYVYHICAPYLQRLEEGVRCPEPGVMVSCEYYLVLRI